MRTSRAVLVLASGLLVCATAGCPPLSQQQVYQNGALAEQNRAQLAEIENLRVHARQVENQLIRTEQEMALLGEQAGVDRKQLANFQRERDTLNEQFRGIVGNGARMPADVTRQLAELAARYPDLHFDAEAGVGKFDLDVLFDTGEAELKPAAGEMLRELVRVLKAPEAEELRVMVVGHTDDRRIAGRPVRDRFPNNFHLSAARALAVADLLRESGLADGRLGVAGFGPHQPIAPNATATDRQKNRRVEIFVMAPHVPVVGWSDTMPGVY